MLKFRLPWLGFQRVIHTKVRNWPFFDRSVSIEQKRQSHTKEAILTSAREEISRYFYRRYTKVDVEWKEKTERKSRRREKTDAKVTTAGLKAICHSFLDRTVCCYIWRTLGEAIEKVSLDQMKLSQDSPRGQSISILHSFNTKARIDADCVEIQSCLSLAHLSYTDRRESKDFQY